MTKKQKTVVGIWLTISIIAFICSIIGLVMLRSGSGKQMEQLGDGEHAATHFSVVDKYGRFDVIVDTDTGVMYASNGDMMELLVNWDGSPRCYPGFDAREDRP